jgi:hypothetical protein
MFFTTQYNMKTTWHLPACPDQVFEILTDAKGFTSWWSSVYLKLNLVTDPSQEGINNILLAHTKGWLPYTINWQIEVTNLEQNKFIELKASGDLEGHGRWDIRPIYSGSIVTYDWNIDAKKPLFKYFSWLLKPIFKANHNWAMNQGEIGIKSEIERRRAGQIII